MAYYKLYIRRLVVAIVKIKCATSKHFRFVLIKIES
jgi:hypothetical protein